MRQDEFLFKNTSSSLDSADIIFDVIWEHFKEFRSFVDIGCGLGGWSSVLEKKGILKFKCYDHPSVSIEDLLIKNKENFIAIDLEKLIPIPEKFDLAICIEVLEHFNSNRGFKLIEYLSQCTDFILFSAAVPHQKGIGHINEQRHFYWHKLFAEYGYKYYDGFKPDLYQYEGQIKFYHIQNLFIYYRGTHEEKFIEKRNITSLRFEIVSRDILEKPLSLSDILRQVPLSIWNSLKFRFNKNFKIL